MTTMLLSLLLASLPLLAIYLYQRVYYLRRKQYADWPQLPSSLLWGHMKILQEFIKRGESKRHIDIVFTEIRESLGNPPLFVLDVRPARRVLAVVCSHDVAEQVSKSTKSFPYSMAKSPTLASFDHLLGPGSIVSSQGEEWKSLRKRFNPGFAPQHLLSLLPCILEQGWRFLDNLDAHARAGDEFTLDELCISLTFDIIGAVTMDEDFRAQSPKAQQSEMVDLYRQLVNSYTPNRATGFISSRLKDFRECRHRDVVAQRLNTLLKDLIRRKFGEKAQHQKTTGGKKSRSILALSLQGIDELTPQILDQTCEQLKTFLFAGHDTTSILLQWAFYELSRTPRALHAIRTELDQIFGPDPSPSIVRESLLSDQGDQLIQRMSYTSAVIKETLRLYPPGGTARLQPPGSGCFVTLPDGKSLCLDNTIMYNCATIIQRDEAVYGSTKDDFIPERWLGNTDTSMQTDTSTSGDGDAADKKPGSCSSSIPASAWRPFERGPRNCIGQELANLEARAVLAYAVRRYDFTKVGLGEVARDNVSGAPVLNSNGGYEVQSRLFNTTQVTAKPVDGMRMRVSFAPGASEL